MGGRVLIAGLAGLVLAAAVAGATDAAQPLERFALGQSARTGALCQASRDWADPAVKLTEAAWQVTCKGWENQIFGRIYLFRGQGRSKSLERWRSALANRAQCAPATSTTVAGLGPGSLQQCKASGSNAAYVAYTVRHGGETVSAEGLAPLTDVLETGLKVAAGVAKPPSATETQRQSVAGDTGTIGLNSVALAKASPEARREGAYVEGESYAFDKAASDFGALCSDATQSASAQAEACLNYAFDVSNSGRFKEADAYFALAQKLIERAGSPASLTAWALNYKAAHARAQGDFQLAIRDAKDAIGARPKLALQNASITRDASGALVIGPAAEAALNNGAARFRARQLARYKIEQIRDAQAYQIEGTALQQLGRIQEARDALRMGLSILTSNGLDRVEPWLTARLQADIAENEARAGSPRALTDMAAALTLCEARCPGSLGSGVLQLELGQMQARAGQQGPSIENYEDAIKIFLDSPRHALGGSTDLAGAYFDELLQRIGSNPAAHAADVERYFNASQAVVSEATANLVAQFVARISNGDSRSAGISRAKQDIDRQRDSVNSQLQALQDQISQQQAANAYKGAVKALGDSQMAGLSSQLADLTAQSARLTQQLLEANPRYGAILTAGVKLQDLQASLQPGEAYVKIIMLANRGYGLLVTRSSARPYPIKLSRADAEALVAKVRQPFDDIERTGRLSIYDVALANTLFEDLFGPVRRDVLSAQRLIYEPDATLIGAPVAALVTDKASVDLMERRLRQARRTHQPLNYAGVHWLGAKLDSSVAISTASFWQVRHLGLKQGASKAPHQFIGFGAPVLNDDPDAFSDVKAEASLKAEGAPDVCAPVRDALRQLKPLPGAAEEVRTVAQDLDAPPADVVLGPEFTDTRVEKAGASAGGLDQYRVIYFATHGLLPLPNGCLKPSLVTSRGADGSDGLLDMYKIFDLKLDAEMVVLAACDTGRNGAIGAGEAAVAGGGEALGGLVRAFVSAGARNLVVSNWPADSAATERLMTTMFAKKGVSQDDALRKAQLTMMDSPDRFSHPGFWAAFIVVGDGARPIPGA